MGLQQYRNKRNFKSTPEPDGSKSSKKASPALRFVVQLHEASRRHYDLRLEMDGTMKSWAVPKGPSLDPMERRLAVQVEDHPIEYNDFEGVIPPGNYGAGVVMIWDEGTYRARAVEYPAQNDEDALRRGLEKGHITFIMEGSKLKGEFALIRLAKSDGDNWLLVKKHDAMASRSEITHADRSVRSGRTMGEIAALAPSEGKIWGSQKKTMKVEEKKKDKPVRSKTPSLKRKKLAPALQKKAEAASLATGKPIAWKPAAALPDLKNTVTFPLYDGYRALLRVDEDGDIGLTAKTGLSLSKRFPRLLKALKGLEGPLLLDGLVVPLNEGGEPRRRGRAAAKAELRHAFYIYDILHVDGYDLAGLKLKDRLSAIQDLQLICDDLRFEDSADESESTIGVLQRLADETYHGKNLPRTARGHREARPQREAVHEKEAMPGSRHEVLGRTARPGARQQVALTNLEKIYWPQEKITKGQLLDYYKNVAKFMLPHLRDRPQSLNRHPNGINGTSFFQKEVSGAVPGWMETATIGSGRSGKTVTYALCQTEADLLFLANMGCIEINTWLSRVSAINSPDFIVFDLDPGKIPFDAVIEVARTIKKLLDKLKAPGYCKTSGSRGLHIYVPIKDASSFDEARLFAQKFSEEVHRLHPDTTSLERSPERRANKIYLDYLQNRIGQTMAAVYSVRPKPKATVSTPLRWTEVKAGLDPGIFTITTLPKRLAKWGDLWQDMDAAAVSLSDCQKALDALVQTGKKLPKPPRRPVDKG
ncbi:MAG TPA: non-homologous end-joining DNA ligase [Oligoflexus sp.]|uniref:non-homologous end-joining DNA ligase n=1 Tax=Oligoflexus sp. TaxID=1971216 RepID=UPI002D7E8435|nr:non-homologous end-joining DNA ligase [Oligoflexus sp.]HET9237850.1 non-homologous end-joining DNA ligase [Oligoflexus sp.]